MTRSAWLFERETDLWVFGGPTLASLLLLALGVATGRVEGDASPWVWLVGVLAVDVAHVWSTVWRTYADGEEVARRPLLYVGTPIAAYFAGVALHLAGGPQLFWRVLAYAAVFHFVRQQYGWVRLLRRRAGESDRLGEAIDGATIYLATLWPLAHWHTHLPRRFNWFVPGDFAAGMPLIVSDVLGIAFALALGAYLLKALRDGLRGGLIPWGKHLVVATTTLCWVLGIVVWNGDWAFTVTNVLIHGIPYVALVHRYGRNRFGAEPTTLGRLFRAGWPYVHGLLILIAFMEEGLWDNLVWHDHGEFFGSSGIELGGAALAWLVPLLALPQATHYALDGFIWRVGPQNPGLAERLGF